MKVLMFGWEFPPFVSGGLGTACYGLTKSLSSNGVDVTFVMPKTPYTPESSHVNLIAANRFKNLSDLNEVGLNENYSFNIKEISTLVKGYLSSADYKRILNERINGINEDQNGFSKDDSDNNSIYGDNLYEEVYRLSRKAAEIVKADKYDVIHAHDWMTYPSGIRAKEVSGKPLIVHIHATEFDRTAGHPDEIIYRIEKEGFEKADMILAVSELTRQKVINNYNINPNKVKVVYNAVDFPVLHDPKSLKDKGNKIVLFLGRLTIQKGPEHFLWAAKKVADLRDDVHFVVAGTGDMESRMKSLANDLGIIDRVSFLGYLSGKAVDDAYRNADLYVMPSLSEPFGITPLESLRNGTPILISKQSGVSEIVNHCLKVDFWDINQMANKMVSVLSYPELYGELSVNGNEEVKNLNWSDAADKCISYYHEVMK